MLDEQKGSRYSQIRVINALPRNKTEASVPSGRWCLSTLSTVPYVRITGPGGYQKEFSWNEVIEVPEGTAGVLENMSYHPGDIILNGGHDWGAVPARITVPVTLGSLVGGVVVPLPDPLVFPVTIVPSWPVDTRRARRAFLAIEWQTGNKPELIAADTVFNINGYAEQRSHRTFNGHSPPGTPPGIGYETFYIAPAGTRFGIIPLGFSASNGDGGEPHALLDYANFNAHFNDNYLTLFIRSAYYIVEY